MLAAFTELLEYARGRGAALGAFTCYDLATATGVVTAAERRRAPVVLLVSGRAFSERGGEALVSGLRRLADGPGPDVCVQLDHVTGLDSVRLAVAAGANAVMVDGSHLPFERNVALVSEAISIARPAGVEVEGELGRLAGDEDVAGVGGIGALTDPAQAKSFVAATGLACLAVSIGNLHGTYRGTPHLDFDLLAEISATVGTPLALHGASGIDASDIERARRTGISKVNVNTELRVQWLAAVTDSARSRVAGHDLLGLQRDLAAAICDTVDAKLGLLGWSVDQHSVVPTDDNERMAK